MTKSTVPAQQISDPDLVDRIFEYLLTEFPQIAGDRLEESKKAVRGEFGGQRPYIATRASTDLAKKVLSLFDGRNAREVARRLGVSRGTVYRVIKQAGEEKKSHVLPSNETTRAVRSKPSVATLAAAPNQE
ncbi:MAG: helix-turn-helix domain-containing protein [Pseudomonadota bacterium]